MSKICDICQVSCIVGSSNVAAGMLEQNNFDLFMAGAEMDIAAWRVCVTTCGDREADKAVKEQAWRKQRHTRCSEQAALMLDPESPMCSMIIVTLQDTTL